MVTNSRLEGRLITQKAHKVSSCFIVLVEELDLVLLPFCKKDCL